MTVPVRRLAFFDVDETILATKSMLHFWDHWTRAEGGGGGDTARVADLGAMAAAGARRTALNRAYFERYAGVPLGALRRAADRWYASYRMGAEGFVTATVEALERHRAAGHEVILVSGSASPLLEPVARDFGAARTLCTELLTGADGLLTGRVRFPMIGDAKAEGVAAAMHERGVSPQDCFAYGDHESDLGMLRQVGNPLVVGDDPVLRNEAGRGGWEILPARPGPRRPARYG